MSAQIRLTYWFDPRARTLYHVRGDLARERIRDIARGARFSGVSVYKVSVAWVAYQRAHDPFQREIDLAPDTADTPLLKRVTVRSEILKLEKTA